MRSPSSSGGIGRNDAERTIGVLLGGLVLFAILVCGLWYRFHTEISHVLLAEQHLTLRAFSLITHRYDGLRLDLEEALPERVTAAKLWQLFTITGSALRWPLAALIAAMAVLCIRRAPREQYRERLGLDGMQRTLARIHPVGSAFLGNDAVLVAPSPTAQALKPLDPALRIEEWKARYCQGDTQQARSDAAERALGDQLGTVWTSPEEASPIVQTLFVAFALQAERRKKDSAALLGRLSKSFSGCFDKGVPNKPLTVPADISRLVRRYLKRNDWTKARDLTDKHAYSVPALLSLLQFARVQTGIFNPGLFACIQLVDRNLWLALSAVSYPRDGLPRHIVSIASCIEASGALEHWRAECEAGDKLHRKKIERSLEVLEIT